MKRNQYVRSGKMKRCLAGVLLITAFAAGGGASAQPCVTLVADLHGGVAVADRPAAKPEDRWPVQLLQCFPAGKAVIMEAGARVTLFYPGSGEAVELRGPGNFQLNADGVRAVSGAAAPPSRVQLNTAFRDIKLDRTRLAPGGVRMRDPRLTGAVNLLEPSGVVLRQDAVVFRWQPIKGIQDYRFRLMDAQRQVLLDERTQAAELTVPQAELKTGERLYWQVETAAPAARRSQWLEFVIATPAARGRAGQLDQEVPAPSAVERNLREVLLLQDMAVE